MKWLLLAVALYLLWRYWWGARAKVSAEMRARAVLGVDARADAPTIRAAHRRLIQTAHPDNGGSAAQAADVNLARDTLLARLPKELR